MTDKTCSVRVTITGGASIEAKQRVAWLVDGALRELADEVFGIIATPSKPRRSRRKHS
jgi:hypothetical protein